LPSFLSPGTLKKILATDHDLSFLMKLTVSELETLVASIRGRVDLQDAF
jgi:hypothetical protein